MQQSMTLPISNGKVHLQRNSLIKFKYFSSRLFFLLSSIAVLNLQKEQRLYFITDKSITNGTVQILFPQKSPFMKQHKWNFFVSRFPKHALNVLIYCNNRHTVQGSLCIVFQNNYI